MLKFLYCFSVRALVDKDDIIIGLSFLLYSYSSIYNDIKLALRLVNSFLVKWNNNNPTKQIELKEIIKYVGRIYDILKDSDEIFIKIDALEKMDLN